jgi:hypothetical protein
MQSHSDVFFWSSICPYYFYLSIYLYYKRAKELKITSHPDVSYPPKLISLRSQIQRIWSPVIIWRTGPAGKLLIVYVFIHAVPRITIFFPPKKYTHPPNIINLTEVLYCFFFPKGNNAHITSRSLLFFQKKITHISYASQNVGLIFFLFSNLLEANPIPSLYVLHMSIYEYITSTITWPIQSQQVHRCW